MEEEIDNYIRCNNNFDKTTKYNVRNANCLRLQRLCKTRALTLPSGASSKGPVNP